jgi:hypothetical protein
MTESVNKLDALAPECRIPNHVQQIVGKTSDEKPRPGTMSSFQAPDARAQPFWGPIAHRTQIGHRLRQSHSGHTPEQQRRNEHDYPVVVWAIAKKCLTRM